MSKLVDGVIELGLNIKATAKNIQEGLNSIVNKLKLNITARLDKTKSKKQLQSDLNSMKQDVKVGVKIDKSAAKKKLQEDMKSLDGTSSVKVEVDTDTTELERKMQKVSSNRYKVDASVDGADDLNTVADSLDDINSKSAKTAASFTLVNQAINGMERAAQRMVDTAVDLNTQMTDLRMVTGDDYEAVSRLTDEYNQLAKELKSTTTQVLEASSEWLRQGKTLEETNELIRQSMILSKVGNMESATATQRLTSALNGYKLAASDAAAVVDKLTAVDMEAAVSADGIAEALSHTASSAHIAGVELDKVIAYLTVVQETTQRSASIVGESYKTIFARMSKIANGDAVDDYNEDISDVESSLRELGIELRKSETEFRDFDDVLDEVGAKWNTLNDMQKSDIATAFGGVYQRNNFITLMDNYEKVEKYVNAAANSAGTAAEKFTAYQESVEAHYNSMIASAEALSKQTVPPELLNGFMDAAAAIMDFTAQAHLLEIALASVGSAAAVKGFSTLTAKIKDVYGNLKNLTTAFSILKTTTDGSVSASQFEDLLAVTKNLSTAQLKLVVSNKALTTEQRMTMLTASGLTTEQAAQTLSTMGLATAEGAATTATFSLTGAMQALKAAIASNPIGFLVVALTSAVSVISAVTSELEQARVEEIALAKQAAETAAQESEAISDLTSEYLRLAEAVKTDESAKESLLETQDELLKKLGYEGDKIQELVDKYGSLDAAIKNVSISALQESERDLRAGVNANEDSLLDAAKPSGVAKKGLNHIITTWSRKEKETNLNALNALVDAGYISSGSFTGGGMELWLTDMDLTTAEGIIEAHERLGKMIDIVTDNAGHENEVYKVLYSTYNKVTDSANGYKDSINGLNTNLAQQAVLSASIGKELPQTKEEFDAFRQEVIDTTLATENYAGSAEDIKSAIDSVLSSQSAYSNFYTTVAEQTETVVDKNKDVISSYKNTIGILKQVSEEYASTGTVTTETYNKVIALNEDYANMFDFSTGKIVLQTDALETHVDSLVNETGALLAANNATDDEINALASMASAFRQAATETEVTTSSLQSLVDLYKDAKEGTEFSTLAMLDLIEQYPELIGAIEQTATGYKLEEGAVRELIVEKANLYKINESLAKQAAREKLDKATNNDGKTSATVDTIFEEYYTDTGKQIETFDEYVTAWEKHFNEKATGGWVSGLEEYVDASIDEIKRLATIDMLLADVFDPENYRFGDTNSSSSSSSNAETEFEKAYKKHQHLLNMDQESVADYLKWLNSAYKAAYDAGQIELDDYYKYQEEVYSKTQDLFKDSIGDTEHKISLLDRQDGTTEEIVALYQKLQEAVHEQAEKYRAAGLDDNNSLIQELQNQWWDYYDAITAKMVESYEEIVNSSQNQITLTENLLNNAVADGNYTKVRQYSDEIIAQYRKMQETIHEEAEYYRSLGYSDTSDEVSKLSDLWWDYQANIAEAASAGFQALVVNANSALDEIQDVYSTLKDAAQEQADSGFLTVDTYQKILSLGANYLAYLTNENGQLVINEENIKKCVAARTQQVAVETALNYIQQLRTALTNNDTAALQNLLYATDAATDSTWGLVYAQLAALELTDDQYNTALQRIDAIRSLADNAVTSIGQETGQIAEQANQAAEAMKEQLQQTSDALDDILKYTIEMIKQEVNNQVDALKQQVKEYQNIVDLKKESLELTKEQDEYDENVADKVKDISKLEAKIQQLSLDDSREAQAEKAKLQEELAEMQNDLADYQSDYAYDATIDSLDKQAEAYEAEKEKEIAILEDSISSYEKVYQLAIDRINNQWDTLYMDLINWNTQYGSDTNEQITSAWNNASAAVQQYGNYLAAVQATQAALNAATSASSSSSFGSTTSSGSLNLGSSNDYSADAAKGRQVSNLVSKMKANSAAWWNASDEQRQALEEENTQLATQVQALLGKKLVRGADGVWYIGSVDSNDLLYEKYHEGGIVGGKPTLKDKETIAVLEKGELVLDEKQKETLHKAFSIFDQVGVDRDKFNAVMFGQNSNQVMTKMDEIGKQSMNEAMNQISTNKYVNAPNVDASVTIHGDVDGDTWKKIYPVLKDHQKQVADITCKEIMSTFSRRGIRK